VAQIRIRSLWDTNNAIMGLLYAVIIGTLFQVIVKQIVGGFRPFFLDVCKPDISLASTNNQTGLNGVGFKQIMYTAEICTNPNKNSLKNAMTSFPSGHSTAGFAGYGFLFLWVNAKLKVWSDHRPAFWKLAITFVPILAAFLIACSLSIDQAHNWYDIVAGSLLGIILAIASYRSMYAAVWDWRFNHLPLKRDGPFTYTSDGVDQGRVFTRAGGWGRRRAVVSRKQTHSARTSENHSPSRHHHMAEQNVQPPMATVGRTRYSPKRDRTSGDDMV
jgi:diacylglycerol diphosphate phosphatase / phosphatidate phosphatase